tara:strand:+ start:309 stop:512 length:204 start_codon:yes stop_codon:yes gene_type:complete
MARYRIETSYTRWYTLEVEADSYADAEDRFHEEDVLEDDGSRRGWVLEDVREDLVSITQLDTSTKTR